jgi:hypothetical protein
MFSLPSILQYLTRTDDTRKLTGARFRSGRLPWSLKEMRSEGKDSRGFVATRGISSTISPPPEAARKPSPPVAGDQTLGEDLSQIFSDPSDQDLTPQIKSLI